MHESSAPLAPEIEAIRGIYAAINRGDAPAAVSAFDPQGEWVDPAELPGAGTHRGHAAMMANVVKGRSTWAEGACEPERFIVAGDKIVVFVRVRVRLKDRADWIDAPIADVCTFRDGKIVQFRTFGDRRAALEWAGAEDPEAS